MFKKTLLATLTATVLFAGAAQATDNPLHPSYYQDKAGQWAQPVATVNTARYVDATNPLNPAYSRTGEAKWVETSDVNVVAYVDSRNPLSPSFKR